MGSVASSISNERSQGPSRPMPTLIATNFSTSQNHPPHGAFNGGQANHWASGGNGAMEDQSMAG